VRLTETLLSLMSDGKLYLVKRQHAQGQGDLQLIATHERSKQGHWRSTVTIMD
jgi:hypothetical protein